LTTRPSNTEKGRQAERLAAAYLESLGYSILATNWRCPLGELDIVASMGTRLVFFEVKYRSGGAFGSGEEALTRSKVQRLQRLAQAYMQADPSLRFASFGLEVVSVTRAPAGPEFRITPAI
jgi:putative endonuclease